jgi:hypothetical protein
VLLAKLLKLSQKLRLKNKANKKLIKYKNNLNRLNKKNLNLLIKRNQKKSKMINKYRKMINQIIIIKTNKQNSNKIKKKELLLLKKSLMNKV